MKTNEGEVNLIDELNQAASDAEIQASEGIKPKDETIQNIVDKELIFEDVDEDEENINSEIQKEENKGAEQKKISSDEAERTAKRYVKALNGLMKLVLPGLARKKILKKGDKKLIDEHLALTEVNPNRAKQVEEAVTYDSPLYKAMKRYERLEKYIDEVPFNEDERKELIEPLSEMVQKYPWMQMGPEMSLVLSVCIIMAPRLEPFIPGFNKIVKEDE